VSRELNPVDPRRDHEAWEQLLQRAGVKDGRLHAARHFAGTLMLGTGTDITVIQEVLGHADIRTARGYTEVALDLKRQAVERAAAALFDGQLASLLLPSGATSRQGQGSPG
jgi:site-specific recombinase XerD